MSGIYVAFDASGRDYAYAVHLDLCKADGYDAEQRYEIRKMQRQARSIGGTVKLLTGDEFDALRKKSSGSNSHGME